MELLKVKNLEVRIGESVLCRGLDFTIKAGERWCLLGKNGVGKTTLMHALIGLHPVFAGSVCLEGHNLAKLRRRDIARKAGILFQEGLDSMPATVLETVLLGRHPHLQSLLLDSDKDLDIAREAVQIMGLEELQSRRIDRLSGGEHQRLALAKLLAQQPRVYFLDEPSNHLDMGFQVRLQRVLQERLQRDGAGLIMATHDINLGARFCDRFLLLAGKGSAIIGDRNRILTRDKLSAAFDCPVESVSRNGIAFFYPV